MIPLRLPVPEAVEKGDFDKFFNHIYLLQLPFFTGRVIDQTYELEIDHLRFGRLVLFDDQITRFGGDEKDTVLKLFKNSATSAFRSSDPSIVNLYFSR